MRKIAGVFWTWLRIIISTIIPVPTLVKRWTLIRCSDAAFDIHYYIPRSISRIFLRQVYSVDSFYYGQVVIYARGQVLARSVFRLKKSLAVNECALHNWQVDDSGTLKLRRGRAYPINGVKSTGSWNLICILYTRCAVRMCRLRIHISSGKFSRGALAFIHPRVIPRSRASTAYNRINAAIREQAFNVIH